MKFVRREVDAIGCKRKKYCDFFNKNEKIRLQVDELSTII